MARLTVTLGCDLTPYGLLRVWWEFEDGRIERDVWKWPPQERREKIRRIDGRGNARRN